MIIQVMNDQLFVAAGCLGEFDALLDFTMCLKKVEDGKVINIVVVLLQELVKLLLEYLQLFFADLTQTCILTHYATLTFCDLRQTQLNDPRAYDEALRTPLVFWFRHIFHVSALLLWWLFRL